MSNAIVFPSDPFSPNKVDEEFADEAQMVQSLGGSIILVDHTELEQKNFVAKRLMSLAKVSEHEALMGHDEEKAFADSLPAHVVYEAHAFYRGWMMSAETYQFMRWQLGIRTIDMVSDTSDYTAGYYFGNWYSIFEEVTPKSTYFPAAFPFAEMQRIVSEDIGKGRYIVKDHVKSRKSDWDTACYVPDPSKLESVIKEFIRLQGEYLAGGIVVREFEDFVKEAGEARVWWVGNEPVMVSPHPDTPDRMPDFDISFLKPYVERLNRPFVTTDVALREDGAVRVIEVSDGQVSGLPRGFDPTPLFQSLLNYQKGKK